MAKECVEEKLDLPIMHRFPRIEDVACLCTSKDYKIRFFGEYWELKIRARKLCNFINKIEVAGDYYESKQPMPDYDCPLEMLKDQVTIMGTYLKLLEQRAIIEGIDLQIL